MSDAVVRGWYTTKQAAETLNVSERHFWRLAEERNLKRQMLNKRSSLWVASEVNKLANQRAKNGN